LEGNKNAWRLVNAAVPLIGAELLLYFD